MKSKGFTLVELMVVIVIMGILAAVGVPKLTGAIAKAKVSEISPAASSYIKLQKAYMIEFGNIGSWRKIGYSAPGRGVTDNFEYGRGSITRAVKKADFQTTLGGDGLIGWQAENLVSMGDCSPGNKWVIYVVAVNDTTIQYRPEILASRNSQACLALDADWGGVDHSVISSDRIEVASNTPESSGQEGDPESTSSGSSAPVASSDSQLQVLRDCAKMGGWLNGNESGWAHNNKQECYALREELIKSGDLVCDKANCKQYVYKDDAVRCRVAGGSGCPDNN